MQKKSLLWLLVLTVVATFSWHAAVSADSGPQLRRGDSLPDAGLEDAPAMPESPEPRQLQRTRALPSLEGIPDLRTDEGKEELIRRSYAAVRLYSLASGNHPSFELSDFRTIQRVEFGRFQWFDLVTPPGGQVIQMVRHTSRATDGRPLTRQYQPLWTPAPQEYSESKEGKRLANARIDEILAVASADTPELLGVTSVTTYRVQVTLDDETRAYRAAFLWKETGTSLTYQAYDQITGLVDQALAEKVPAGRRKLDRDPVLDDLRSASGALIGETCESGSVADRSFGLSAAGFQGHSSGSHSLSGSVSMHCSCTTGCEQTCNANASPSSCSDFGSTDKCHKLSNMDEDSSGSTVPFATSFGSTASCGGGVACGWKACLGCFCSASVSASWNGFGLSVSTDPGTAALADSHTYTCPPCNVIPEDDPTDDPPSGGGSGGGGGGDEGGGGCSCDCDGDGWVTVEECTFDCGGIADTEEGVCWV